MDDSKDEMLKKYFSLQYWMFEMVGFSRKTPGIFYQLYKYITYMGIVIYAIVLVPEVLKFQGDVNTIINNIVYAIALWLATAKMVVITKDWPLLVKLFEKLQDKQFLPDFEHDGVYEAQWIEDCISYTRKLGIAGVTQGIVAAICCVAGSLLSGKGGKEREQPFGQFPSMLGIKNYYGQLLIEIWIFLIVVYMYVASDIAYVTLTSHMCVQFKIIKNRLINIIPNYYKLEGIKEENASDIPWSYLKSQINCIIKHHIDILKMGEEVEYIFYIINLAVFGGMCVFICCAMYQASVMTSITIDIAQVFALICASVSLCGMLAYVGNEIIVKSISMADACWETNFIGTDLRFQRMLIFITQRSQKPIQLTVGKFGTLSLMTLVGMLRLSFSYFMFLRNVNTYTK